MAHLAHRVISFFRLFRPVHGSSRLAEVTCKSLRNERDSQSRSPPISLAGQERLWKRSLHIFYRGPFATTTPPSCQFSAMKKITFKSQEKPRLSRVSRRPFFVPLPFVLFRHPAVLHAWSPPNDTRGRAHMTAFRFSS